ncbi:hypothetical protein EON65_21420 [archaeon]|nr:MAG: hypothetical protein EON65_21420 [archaeon]
MSFFLVSMWFGLGAIVYMQPTKPTIATFCIPGLSNFGGKQFLALIAGSTILLPLQNTLVVVGGGDALVALTAFDMKKNILAPQIPLLNGSQFVVNLLPPCIEKQDCEFIR